jgi:hypothetical protein
MKISLQAPNIQRRLSPSVFLNTPFIIYLGIYLLLATLAYTFLFPDLQGWWFVPVAASALLGIGVGNADIKFGGFSLLPLAEFLQGLEVVAQAGISYGVNEKDIEQRASLRDQLADDVATEVLERECRLLGLDEPKLQEFKVQSASSDATYRGLLAREIVSRSEANAHRIIALPLAQRFPPKAPK